jgi:hypothetical protein
MRLDLSISRKSLQINPVLGKYGFFPQNKAIGLGLQLIERRKEQ